MSTASGFEGTPDGLACDGIPLGAMASAVGTPFYAYTASLVRARLEALRVAVAGVPHAIHYALKANSTLALVRLVRSLGAGADANSGGEIEVALRAGFIPQQIVFTGVGKTRDELERAVSLGLKAINAESAGELERIDAVARAQGARARVALRVNPDIDAATHAHISTGLKRSKFGVPIEDAAAICRGAADRPGLELIGVHAHIGSQIRDIAPLRRTAGAIAELARELRASGLPLEHVDVGGGLGIAYDGLEEPDVAAYGAAVVQETRAAGLTLLLEPGRWLMAPTGVLVATVIDVKPAPEGRRFVVLDAGMTELIRPALYGAYHRIVMVAPRAGAPDVLCDVVGPVCESSDTFGRDRSLPDPQVGDAVAILDAGAYGSVMASNYNRRPQPAEVLADQGSWRIIRRRQTIEEQLACEL
jgi:diaminopimelate decarboxylase